MILSKKYNEIMDQVRVTDEMKQRVLQNVKEGIETEKIPESGKIIHSRFLSYGRVSFRCSLYHDAACGRIDCAAAAASGKWTSAGSHGHGSRDGTGRDHGRL